MKKFTPLNIYLASTGAIVLAALFDGGPMAALYVAGGFGLMLAIARAIDEID